VAAAATAAAAAAHRAGELFAAQAAALNELRHEQSVQQQQQQQRSSTTTAAATTAADDSEDEEDDCPPLEHVDSLFDSSAAPTDLLHSTVAVAHGNTAAAVEAECCSNSSVSSSDAVQKLAAQPCVHCGKLTKKRCRRCQAVYYCSEECQIQCFKDPEHKAQCLSAAVAHRQTEFWLQVFE
jgi:MYND finger